VLSEGVRFRCMLLCGSESEAEERRKEAAEAMSENREALAHSMFVVAERQVLYTGEMWHEFDAMRK